MPKARIPFLWTSASLVVLGALTLSVGDRLAAQVGVGFFPTQTTPQPPAAGTDYQKMMMNYQPSATTAPSVFPSAGAQTQGTATQNVGGTSTISGNGEQTNNGGSQGGTSENNNGGTASNEGGSNNGAVSGGTAASGEGVVSGGGGGGATTNVSQGVGNTVQGGGGIVTGGQGVVEGGQGAVGGVNGGNNAPALGGVGGISNSSLGDGVGQWGPPPQGVRHGMGMMNTPTDAAGIPIFNGMDTAGGQWWGTETTVPTGWQEQALPQGRPAAPSMEQGMPQTWQPVGSQLDQTPSQAGNTQNGSYPTIQGLPDGSTATSSIGELSVGLAAANEIIAYQQQEIGSLRTERKNLLAKVNSLEKQLEDLRKLLFAPLRGVAPPESAPRVPRGEAVQVVGEEGVVGATDANVNDDVGVTSQTAGEEVVSSSQPAGEASSDGGGFWQRAANKVVNLFDLF